MLSRTGTYALQATLYLAKQPPDVTVPTSEIAQALAAPVSYLAKVLRLLRVSGLLESTRGVQGGYRLKCEPARITIADVLAPFEEMDIPKTCLMGGPCDLNNPCTAHERRLEWIDARHRILRETTVADLVHENSTEAPRMQPHNS